MAWAGMYSLDLYCDAIKRADGWIIKSDGSAVCPKCSGKKKP
jgi:hypothetical protein